MLYPATVEAQRPIIRSKAKAIKRVKEICAVPKKGADLLSNLKFEPIAKQQHCLELLDDHVHSEIFYGGAARGGKTALGCYWHIRNRLMYPGSVGLIGRDTLINLKRTTLLSFFRLIIKSGLKKHVKYNKNEGIITWENGSITFLMQLTESPQDPDFQTLGGLELTDAFIDELPTVSKSAYEIVQTRLCHMLKEYNLIPKIYATGNPGPHWVKHHFVKDEEGNPIVLAPHMAFIQALPTDNPHISPEYIKQLERANEYDRARLLYGDWDAEERTGMEFYREFRAERHVVAGLYQAQYDPALPLHLTFDFNVHPYNTMLVCQNKGGQVMVLKEYTLPHPENNTQALCRRFIREFDGHVGGVFIYGDPSGRAQDTRTEMGHNDYSIIQLALSKFRPMLKLWPAAPPVHIRGMFINAVFGESFEGLSILIDSQCRNTVRDFQNVKQESSEGGKLKTKVKDGATGISYEPVGHTSDAFDYFITKAFEPQYRKFQRGPDSIPIVGHRTFSRRSHY